jgi:hypothetical protein
MPQTAGTWQWFLPVYGISGIKKLVAKEPYLSKSIQVIPDSPS